MRLLIINGPNINMLGIREPDIYGSDSYGELLRLIDDTAKELGVEYKHFQSNHEGAIIDEIQAALGQFDGIVINPAGYTHTSIAILDALKAVALPAVEVHISNLGQRETFRQISYPGMYCEKTIKGHGIVGYREAMYYLNDKYAKNGCLD